MEAIFFPRNDYPNNVEVCPHRFGKSMTYTEQSDGFHSGAEDITNLFIQKGIKIGVFWPTVSSETTAYRDLALQYISDDLMWIDAYCNPANSEDKQHVVTQQEYEAARDAILERISDWFGARPVALSYANGNDTYKDMAIIDFLACRNSNKNGGTTYGLNYGSPDDIPYSKAFYKSKASTSRWYDDVVAAGSTWTFESRLQKLAYDIAATKLNNGWYNNFTHWHNVIRDGNLQAYSEYIDLLDSLNSNGDIYFAGYGEAVAYLVYRQMIKKTVMYSPLMHRKGQLIIQLETDNNGLDVNPDLLQVPISVKFSTVGTPLANQAITSNCNLINLGSGEYIVEIPFSRFPKAVIEKINV